MSPRPLLAALPLCAASTLLPAALALAPRPVHAAQQAPAPAPQAPAWKAKDKIDIFWGGKWYPGEVLEVKDGKFKVHYDGYGSNWDEWATPDRLRARTGKTEEGPKTGPGGFKVGDRVEAWNVTWYPATIMVIGTGEYAGYYKVHYENFGGASDQWLKADNVRAVKAPAKPGEGPQPRAGKYVILSYGSISNPLRLGTFELLAGGRYRSYDTGGKLLGEGRYTFNAKGNTVEWVDGPFKKSGWGGEFTVEREGKTHKIRFNRVTVGTNSTDS